jgi:hypothetical protein
MMMAVGLAVVLAGCAVEGAEQLDQSLPLPAAPRVTVTVKPANPTTPEVRTSTTVSHASFVKRCVDYTLLQAFIGDEISRARWDSAGQDEARLEGVCQTIAETDPAVAGAIDRQIDEMNNFFAAVDAEEDRQETERATNEYMAAVAAEAASQETEARRQGKRS